MKPGMIKLEAPKNAHGEIVVGWSFPYAKSGFGKLTHRVRHGVSIVRGGILRHVALQVYCSQICFIDDEAKCATLTPDLPEGETLCSYCEIKAVKRGQPPTKHATIQQSQ